MSYAEFAATEAYASTYAGSAIQVLIVNEEDPTDQVIANTTGLQVSEDYESLPVEEAGEEGVNEIAQGRHSGSLSIPGFWRPTLNDQLPTRQSFLGKRYTIFERVAAGREGAGTILNAYVGCRINRNGQSFGARGLKSFDLAMLFTRRYSGEEWAAISPS